MPKNAEQPRFLVIFCSQNLNTEIPRLVSADYKPNFDNLVRILSEGGLYPGRTLSEAEKNAENV